MFESKGQIACLRPKTFFLNEFFFERNYKFVLLHEGWSRVTTGQHEIDFVHHLEKNGFVGDQVLVSIVLISIRETIRHWHIGLDGSMTCLRPKTFFLNEVFFGVAHDTFVRVKFHATQNSTLFSSLQHYHGELILYVVMFFVPIVFTSNHYL